MKNKKLAERIRTVVREVINDSLPQFIMEVLAEKISNQTVLTEKRSTESKIQSDNSIKIVETKQKPVIVPDLMYAQKIIKGRWLEGERVLLSMSAANDKDLPYELYLYALNVIKGPWREAERIIFQDPEVAANYAANITKEKLPKEIEDEIANYRDVSIAIDYAVDVYKKRWPEYERNLLKIKDELQDFLDRMGDVDDEDYPEDIAFVHIEPIIDQYKKEVIKGDWPEAEIIR